VADMLRAYLGTADQITGGRDLHTGAPSRGVVPPISFVASLLPVMAGMALASRLRGEDRVSLTWVGDGATRTAEFHEGMNFAAVQRLPLVVVVQDNGVALGTRREAHTAGPLPELARAYGVCGLPCDGNNVLDVHGAALEAVDRCRGGEGPVLLFATTFRMGGHATHDEAEARTLFDAGRFAHWGARDPIGVFEAWLKSFPRPLDDSPPACSRDVSALNRRLIEETEARVTAEVERAATEALASRAERMPDPAAALGGVLAGSGDGPEPAFAPLTLPPAGALAHP
jgi:TPP-dependent pyruvate/acetoin dehydrogenase alpha subunit